MSDTINIDTTTFADDVAERERLAADIHAGWERICALKMKLDALDTKIFRMGEALCAAQQPHRQSDKP